MERMTTKKGDSTNANNTSHTGRLFHEGNYITSAYKRESVGMGYDYSECLSDDEDALMDTTTDTYIGYTSYRGHFHKTQMQSALGNNTLTPLSHLKSPSVESKGPEHVSTSTLSKSTPKMNGPPISRLPPSRGEGNKVNSTSHYIKHKLTPLKIKEDKKWACGPHRGKS